MGSSRLPNKVLMKVNGEQTVLEHVIKQLSFCKSISKIIVATTNLKQDDVIGELVKKLEIDVFRGDSSDVLDRYYQCAKKFNLDNIVRITSDCPLIDPEIVDKVIRKYEIEKFDYVIDLVNISNDPASELNRKFTYKVNYLNKLNLYKKLRENPKIITHRRFELNNY